MLAGLLFFFPAVGQAASSAATTGAGDYRTKKRRIILDGKTLLLDEDQLADILNRRLQEPPKAPQAPTKAPEKFPATPAYAELEKQLEPDLRPLLMELARRFQRMRDEEEVLLLIGA